MNFVLVCLIQPNETFLSSHPIYFRFLLAVSCEVFIINVLLNANEKYAVSLKCSFCVQH